ncbi:MAG: extracellular solute-binding protein [Xenococcaceae cyanobacterium MO_207.B15]|nr:extracellular solute-binding protein [Xenococcaceae cyanobacterium MO_207.B15]
MIGRRSFLVSIATLTLAQLLSSCSNAPQGFKINLLQGSIPPQLIGDFRKTISNKQQLDFSPEAQLSEIFKLLNNSLATESSPNFFTNLLGQNRQKSAKKPDLVTLGDYWLESAISQKLLQPLDTNQLNNWNSLPSLWQQLVKRDSQGKLSNNGEIYGAPYRWGNTVIVYRKDKFQDLDWTPQDWDDLWREDLRDRISLVDNYREIIGLTLKSLGHSYNTQNLASIPHLETQLTQLNQQVKFYSSNKYLQSLIIGDTWLAVGWSSDILPLMKRYSNLAVVVPKSGTSLWADVWVKPTPIADRDTLDNSDLLTKWIDFCWETKAAKQISLFTDAISPLWTPEKRSNLTKNVQNQDFIAASFDTLAQSEFIYPLNSETTQKYLSFWLKMRQ